MAQLWDCWLEMCRRNVLTAVEVSRVFHRHVQHQTIHTTQARLEWFDTPQERTGFSQVGWLYVEEMIVGPLSKRREVDVARYAIYDQVPPGTLAARYKTTSQSIEHV